MEAMSEPCQFLEWDTQFFGHRIGRLQAHRLDSRLWEAIDEWQRTNAIECLYFLADSDDPQTISLAQAHGFQLVEVRLTFERSLKDWDPLTRPRATEDLLIRPAQPQDIPTLQEIAKNSYVDSRLLLRSALCGTEMAGLLPHLGEEELFGRSRTGAGSRKRR